MGTNRNHKSSVFSILFENEDTLRDLYAAIEGVTLPPDVPIKINTLKDALFKNKINDISFEIGDKLVVLIEHQSTINPNMPARLLSYVARIYEKILAGYKKAKLYGTKGIILPRPQFIVLYNGVDPYPDYSVLKLSDCFADASDLGLLAGLPPDLELAVRVYNINEGHNREIARKNETLNDYAVFIAKVREFTAGLSSGKNKDNFTEEERSAAEKTAMEKAIKWCVARGILKNFLEQHGTEVINMLYDEWRLDEALAVEREEGREEGRETRGLEIARNMRLKGLSPEIISETTGFDIQTIQRL